MKNNRKPFVPSVGLIIFGFIFCYPLGWLFLFLRLHNSIWKSYEPVNYKNEPIQSFKMNIGYRTVRTIQIVFGVIFAMYAIDGIFDWLNYGYFDPDSIVIGLILSVLCLYFGYRRTAKLKKYQPYLNYLAAYGTDPIYDLAYSLGISHEKAVQDLSDMIGCGMIKASISDDDFIVLDSNPAKIPSKSRYEKKFIRCPFCGAPNAIEPGQARKCEYCDSPLE